MAPSRSNAAETNLYKCGKPGGAEKVLSEAPSNGSSHGRLQKRQPLLSDLGDLSVFIDIS